MAHQEGSERKVDGLVVRPEKAEKKDGASAEATERKASDSEFEIMRPLWVHSSSSYHIYVWEYHHKPLIVEEEKRSCRQAKPKFFLVQLFRAVA